MNRFLLSIFFLGWFGLVVFAETAPFLTQQNVGSHPFTAQLLTGWGNALWWTPEQSVLRNPAFLGWVRPKQMGVLNRTTPFDLNETRFTITMPYNTQTIGFSMDYTQLSDIPLATKSLGERPELIGEKTACWASGTAIWAKPVAHHISIGLRAHVLTVDLIEDTASGWTSDWGIAYRSADFYSGITVLNLVQSGLQWTDRLEHFDTNVLAEVGHLYSLWGLNVAADLDRIKTTLSVPISPIDEPMTKKMNAPLILFFEPQFQYEDSDWDIQVGVLLQMNRLVLQYHQSMASRLHLTSDHYFGLSYYW